MEHINLQGMGVALVTPFKTNGDIDYRALERLVDYQLQNGTDYLVVLGTTAETSTLSADEQKEITRLVVERVNGKIPIVLGVSSNNTLALVERLKEDDFSGIDAILSVVPYYNKPSQEGIYQHYKLVAGSTPLPIVMYNVPGRTGMNMSAETTLRIANDFDNIVAVKEASGNIAQIGTIIKNKPFGFQVISGDDGITFPLITLGAVGVICVTGNAFPKEFGRMVHSALSCDYASALPIHHSLTEIFELLFVDGSPAGIKSILSMMGYIENVLRLPLVQARTTTYERIKTVLQELNTQC